MIIRYKRKLGAFSLEVIEVGAKMIAVVVTAVGYVGDFGTI